MISDFRPPEAEEIGLLIITISDSRPPEAEEIRLLIITISGFRPSEAEENFAQYGNRDCR